MSGTSSILGISPSHPRGLAQRADCIGIGSRGGTPEWRRLRSGFCTSPPQVSLPAAISESLTIVGLRFARVVATNFPEDFHLRANGHAGHTRGTVFGIVASRTEVPPSLGSLRTTQVRFTAEVAEHAENSQGVRLSPRPLRPLRFNWLGNSIGPEDSSQLARGALGAGGSSRHHHWVASGLTRGHISSSVLPS